MKIKSIIIQALKNCISLLEYPDKDIQLSPRNNPDFGDLSTNLALSLSKDLKENPIKICNKIADKLILDNELIEKVTVSKPGFINFKINNNYYNEILNEIVQNDKYGKGELGKDKTANVEFVSANPTGPLTIGHGRNAVLGDCIATVSYTHLTLPTKA